MSNFPNNTDSISEFESFMKHLDPSKPNVVTVVGSGGKTSIIRFLADYFHKKFQKKVLITTTTKILFTDKFPFYYESALSESSIVEEITEPVIIAGSSVSKENKILPLSNGIIKNLRDYFPLVLIEGDGSKGKSLKGYNNYEPVIPDFTDIVITVLGADIIGKKFSPENVHRFEVLEKKLNKEQNSYINLSDIENALKSCYIPNLPENKPNFLVFNKVKKNLEKEMEEFIKKFKKECDFFKDIYSIKFKKIGS